MIGDVVGIRLRGSRLNEDAAADVVLDDEDLLGLHELQQDQEGDDDFLPAGAGLQEGAEVGMRVGLQVGTDVEGLGVHADFFASDLAEAAADGIAAAFFSAEDFAEDLLQGLEVGVPEQVVVIDGRLVIADLFGEVLGAEKAPAGFLAADGEFLGEIFVQLIFQKAPHQLLAGISLLLAGLLVLFAGQEHAALDVQEGCRHDEKFAGDVHVLVVHLVDIFEVLVGDLDDRNIVDVDLVFFDQVHEEVQRAFEHRKLYGNCHSLFAGVLVF